jgi:hypothetical protein
VVEQTYRTAFQDGLPALYHYEKFNAGHLATTLRDKIIHCAKSASLNDPWDCKPAFDPHSLDDPKVLEREIAWRVEAPGKDLWAARMRTDPRARVDFMGDASKWMVEMLSGRRIYCVTPRPDSTLMWSHYAENHRGICLEFGVADNMLFRFARKVQYRDEYPRWVPCDINDKPDRVGELILTKSSDWSYEEEYRLISMDGHPFLHLCGDFFRLPNGALKSVIIGCEADHRTIGAFIKECVPEMPLKRAVRSPNIYRLEIVEY